MKQSHQSLALAGLLAVVLAMSGCASTGGAGDMSSGGSGSSGSSGSSGTSGAYDSAASSGTDAAGVATGTAMTTATADMQDDPSKRTAATAPAATPVPNGTVLAIETMPATGGVSEGDASMGATGTSGAAGSTGAGQAYRVTVRMDDGSTQVITHNTTPDFRSGERINVTGGAIQR